MVLYLQMLNSPIKYRAHLLIVLANLFFAINMSTVKHLTTNHFIAPYAINILRVGISALLFWSMALFSPKQPLGILKKDIKTFVLCAICGIALNQTFFIKGLSYTLATHAALLLLVTPILISLAALYFLREKFTSQKALGLLLGCSGAVLLISQRTTVKGASNIVLGDVLIILNAIVYAIYFIMVKPLMLKYNAVHVIRWVFTIGFFMIFPLGYQELSNTNFSSFSSTEWYCIGSVVILGTFCAYLFTIFSIKHLGAAVSGAYIYTQPVFATIIAWLFLNDGMDMPRLMAGLLIFTGVYFTQKSKT